MNCFGFAPFVFDSLKSGVWYSRSKSWKCAWVQ